MSKYKGSMAPALYQHIAGRRTYASANWAIIDPENGLLPVTWTKECQLEPLGKISVQLESEYKYFMLQKWTWNYPKMAAI